MYSLNWVSRTRLYAHFLIFLLRLLVFSWGPSLIMVKMCIPSHCNFSLFIFHFSLFKRIPSSLDSAKILPQKEFLGEKGKFFITQIKEIYSLPLLFIFPILKKLHLPRTFNGKIFDQINYDVLKILLNSFLNLSLAKVSQIYIEIICSRLLVTTVRICDDLPSFGPNVNYLRPNSIISIETV